MTEEWQGPAVALQGSVKLTAVTPQNVTLTRDVTIFNAKCNKVSMQNETIFFNAKCDIAK